MNLSINTELEKIFHFLNNEYFDSELTPPVFRIEEKGYHGTFVSHAIISNGKQHSYEYVIPVYLLNENIYEVVGTIAHLMVHHYGFVHDLKFGSNNDHYHNKRFAKKAREVGLEVKKSNSIRGYETKSSDELIQRCKDVGISKKWGSRYTIAGHKSSSTRKYICPCCGNSFRATKNINVLCMDCGVQFVKVD